MRPATPTDLHGSVAVVTGGGGGLGAVIAHALSKAGASVGLVARNRQRLAETAAVIENDGGTVASAVADITDEAAMRRALEDLRARLGPVDVLVNNAGVSGPCGSTWEIDPDVWWHTVDVNLRGTLVCTRLVMPLMVERAQGRIINVTSQAGAFRWPTMSAYSVSKAAVIKLTENLSVEARRTGVTVFSVHPGILPLGLSEVALSGEPAEGQAEREMQDWIRRELAEGRGADPEQAAALMVRLASGEADALSGRHISVHDDVDALLEDIVEVRRKDRHVLRLRV